MIRVEDVIGVALVVLFFGGLLLACFFIGSEIGEDESEHSMGWHSAYGKWQVRYPDGKVSQPFSRKVAEDYREMFGGEIIPKQSR